MAFFAAFAVVGFAAAYVGPTGLALAGAQAEEPSTVSLYSSSQDDNQSYAAGYAAGKEAAAVDLQRDGYSVYVTPKPTPKPVPVVEADTGGGSPAVAARPLYSGGGSKTEWMTAAGIAQGDWGFVDYIVSRESSWNPNATNASSGACGLIQAYPCSKVPGNGYNPVDNLRWGNGYAVGRYGSWSAAYDFWTSNHWW